MPGDPSSAAFLLVAALLVPGSRLTVANVGLNPLRCGLFTTLREMGAVLRVENARTEGGEPVGDLVAEHGPLRAVDIPAGRAPSMIDEYPILAVAAATATGTTRMRGLAELRVKESDRLAATAAMLAANGIRAEIDGDDLLVHGAGGIPGGGTGRHPYGPPAGDERAGHGAGGRARRSRWTMPASSTPASPASPPW